MLFERGASQEAEELNEVWDSWRSPGMRNGASGWPSQIRRLQVMASPPEHAALDRVWRSVQQRTQPVGATRIQPRKARVGSGFGSLGSAMPVRVAMTAVLLLVMAIPIGLGPGRTLFGDDGALSTLPAFGPATATAMASTAPYTFTPYTLEASRYEPNSVSEPLSLAGASLVQPRMSNRDTLMIGIWRITLAPDQSFQLDETAWDFTRFPSIIIPLTHGERVDYAPMYAHQEQSPVPAESPVGMINLGQRDLEILVVFPEAEPGYLPIGNITTGTATPDLGLFNGIKVERMGWFEVANDVYQWEIAAVRVPVNNGGLNVLNVLSSPAMTYWAEVGDVTITGPEGRTFSVPEGAVIDLRSASSLDTQDGSSGLVLTAQPKADNPTLSQSERAIAPMNGQLTIEATGKFVVEFHSIVVEPGGWFNRTSVAAGSYFLADGQLTLSVPTDQASSALPVGATLYQEQEKLFTFRNESSEPAHLLAIFTWPFVPDPGSIPYNDGLANRDGIEETIVFVSVPLTSERGLHDLQFAAGSTMGTPDLLASTYHEQGIALVAPWDGDVRIIATGNLGGVITAEENATPVPAGGGRESLVSAGSYLLSPQGTGFAVQVSGGPSLAWALLVTPSGISGVANSTAT